MKTLDKNTSASAPGAGGSGASTPGQGRVADPLGPNSEIGRKLRQYYDDLVHDDVPDRFAQLLSQLEQAETAQDKD